MWTAVGNNKRRGKKIRGKWKEKKNLLFMGPKKADFSTQKFRHNHHHHRNNKRKKINWGGERWGVGVVGHAPGNFLLFRHLHTHTHNFWLEYWERDRFTCTVALCTRTEGRAERQMAASKNPSKHSMLPSPPSSFHFDWKTATFYPKKKINSKKSFFPFYNIFLPKNFSLFILFLFLFLCVLFTTDPPYYFFL
jgi:hypothetical protein